MKAKDVMIGDMVRESDGELIIITSIDEQDEGYWQVRGADRLLVEGGDLEPIPLTTEILEKNGFIKDEDRGKEFGQTYHILMPTGYEAHSFTIQVTIYKEPIQGVDVLFKCWGWIPPFNGGLDDIHLCSLKYVHQIQHALRLCGVNELADNFKVE